MRTLKFRFWLKNKLQGVLELREGSILDMAWQWDKVDQFTGLLDKFDKKIYEGDILRFELSEMGYIEVGEIKWIGNGFWMESPNGQNHLPAEDRREIIGNIYENKELLEA